ncbi:MAG: amino acid ABC transporter substrate-binding protein [Idiomarina sp.]|nr:amino acid ABC transporter substrate-binding protein [Idiomarina sp.]
MRFLTPRFLIPRFLIPRFPISRFLVLSASCAFLAACGQAELEPIRIGATMSETGAYATQGIPARDGYLLCEAHVNADGGVWGRPLSFTIYDDASSTAQAAQLYEQLISADQVDLVMGPYGSTLTEAVAPVTELHRYVHISPLAATSSIWEQGREYLFMVLPPAELFLAGLIDLASQHELTRVAILHEDALFPQAAAEGAAALAAEAGMAVRVFNTYASGTTDFSAFIEQLRAEDIEVLGIAASSLSDFVSVTEQLQQLDVSIKILGTSGAVVEYQEALGEAAEYVTGLSAWEPGLANPGLERFVSDYRARFGRDPSFHAAGAYGSCQLLVAGLKQTGNLDQEQLRMALLDLEMTTVFGPYAVDDRGYQIANQGLFIQWQQGQKRIVWPADLAEVEAIIPAPTWSER